jgi:hypothetical protein
MSVNLRIEQFLETLHLSRTAGSIFGDRFGDSRSTAKQVTKRQWHFQNGDNAVADFLEHLPAPLIATAGSPRGKKNAQHGSCAQ